jgi:hypothetical protein
MLRMVIAAFVIFCSTNYTAYGLSCAPPKSAIEEYNKSEYVFKGKALSKSSKNSIDGKLVVFHVEQVWKGPISERIELYESDMWLEFVEGQDYLIYASDELDGKLRGNLCGRTQLWENAKGDAAAFQKEGTLIQVSGGGTAQEGWESGILAVIVVTGLAAAWRFGARRKN